MVIWTEEVEGSLETMVLAGRKVGFWRGGWGSIKRLVTVVWGRGAYRSVTVRANFAGRFSGQQNLWRIVT